jgi:glucose 1-dehydrogenase
MNQYEASVVLVTGAGAGIGFAICRSFAAEGAHVMLNDVDPDLARRAAQTLNAALGRAGVHAYPFDVAEVEAGRSAIDDIVNRFGRLDILVANAGLTHIKPFLETSPEEFDRLVQVNLRGTYFLAQASAQAMIAGRRAGRILILSSVTGLQAIPGFSAYGMTKAALRQMARSLALELGPHGLTVNALAPGATVTERTLQETEHYESAWAAVTPSRRPAYVDDIAAAALFLASPEARQITGQTLVVDGGWTIYSPLPDDTSQAH